MYKSGARLVVEEFSDVRFGPKVGQIDPKWGKSGTISDQIAEPKCTEI